MLWYLDVEKSVKIDVEKQLAEKGYKLSQIVRLKKNKDNQETSHVVLAYNELAEDKYKYICSTYNQGVLNKNVFYSNLTSVLDEFIKRRQTEI